MGRRILIIKLGAFGDLLLADGAIRDICAHHAGDAITILTGPAYRKLYARHPLVQQVLVDPRAPRWRLDRLYRLNRTVAFDTFDIIYDLQKSARTGFYFRLFVRRAAWSGRVRGCALPFTLPERPLTLQEEYAIQLEAAGVPVRYTGSPDLAWMVDDVAAVLAAAGVGDRYVVLLPGASARHAHKCWPHYAELGCQLLAAGYPVVTVPGPADLALCRTMPGTMLTGTGPYLDYFQLAGVLRGAAFVVGNDSGPTHLAALLGTPGVALFGAGGKQYQRNMQRGRFACLYSERIGDITAAEVGARVAAELRGAAVEVSAV
ncbi:MAG: glycosyltransferase family 9 protein [Pseudomonadota bacterium]